uniref:Vitamin K-dependent gamma-glutamyl carboxylase n=1 Tax=Conus textile TaxID=6494 RepID=Q8T9M9_CONTE|nr:vitamin K-dependent gamma-glutamyl carboxylase [Conus textile]
MQRPGKKVAADSEESNDISQQAENRDQLLPQEASPKACEEEDTEDEEEEEDKFYKLFGFSLSDLKSWDSFVRLLSRPADPAGLAYIRVTYGFLMMWDVFEERGLSRADMRWGDDEACRFPLFDFMQPLPLHMMVLLYLIMLIGTGGILLGAKYRVCCVMHLLPYWYIVLLDECSWNNHSYLFGLLSFLLLLCDANHYWSMDGLFNAKVRNTDVPLWNYTLLRTQVFLVYFLAGLKKLDMDWIAGYSMGRLSDHWVFYPFTFLMTEDQVSVLVVHLGGLAIDLFVGYLLFFDKTRPIGVIISSSFHLMNAQMFSIGMFPYAMLGLTPVFFYANWPRALFRRIPRSLRILTPDDGEDDTLPSEKCLYTKEQAKPELASTPEHENTAVRKQLTPPTQPTFRHHAAAAFTVFFILWQMFLPFSHFITKGNNSWTQGLYGYSWDMMVHTRSTQHTRISFINKDTGERGFLDPQAWSKSHRWAHNAKMMKQYARCIARRLKKHEIDNVEIYFDVWISLNHRFQQRIVNPNVDILTAEWSVFKSTPWMMPLLVDLSNWRSKLKEIEDDIFNSTDLYEIVFLADFPGLYLENFVHGSVGSLNISVLQGQVVVEVLPEEDSLEEPYNISISDGQESLIPTGVFHKVYTVSEVPSCYMYIYMVTEETEFLEKLKELEHALNGSLDAPVPDKFAEDPKLDQYMEVLKTKNATPPPTSQEEQSFIQLFMSFLKMHYMSMYRGLQLIKGAMWSMYSGESYREFLKKLELQKMLAENATLVANATQGVNNTQTMNNTLNNTKEKDNTQRVNKPQEKKAPQKADSP